ncbi:unnamed protein product, partial [Phaeothamnion confervicola]
LSANHVYADDVDPRRCASCQKASSHGMRRAAARARIGKEACDCKSGRGMLNMPDLKGSQLLDALRVVEGGKKLGGALLSWSDARRKQLESRLADSRILAAVGISGLHGAGAPATATAAATDDCKGDGALAHDAALLLLPTVPIVAEAAAVAAAAAADISAANAPAAVAVVMPAAAHTQLRTLPADAQLHTLPADAQLHLLSFLAARDLLALAQAARALRTAADQPGAWQAAWDSRFGSVWRSGLVRTAAARWHCHHWRPTAHAPPQGWKVFYSQFALTWREWTVAGCNRLECCLVTLGGVVCDVTGFIDAHPGSPETLLDNAGTDATAFFNDVGHSGHARELMRTLPSVPAPRHRDCGKSGGDRGSSGSGCSFVVLESVRATLERQRAAAAATHAAISFWRPWRDAHCFSCAECGEAFVPWQTPSHAGAATGHGAATAVVAAAGCRHVVGKRRVFFVPLTE